MLQEWIDYYINEDGNFVFTKAYHFARGYCCKNQCLHCPWDYKNQDISEPGEQSPLDDH